MSDELKESGTVTAMSVVGFVFGLIGMLGSFIPCLGSLAFYIGIPAAIISGISLGIAYQQNARRTFAIVALTISLIGVVISGWQYFSIMAAGKKAEIMLKQQQTEREMQKKAYEMQKQSEEMKKQAEQAGKAAEQWQKEMQKQSEDAKQAAEEAQKQMEEMQKQMQKK